MPYKFPNKKVYIPILQETFTKHNYEQNPPIQRPIMKPTKHAAAILK